MPKTKATVRGAVLDGPGQISIREFPRPEAQIDTAIVEIELCGICGTDVKLLGGGEAAPYPLVLGHEGVGRISAIGSDAARRYGVAEGDMVIVESSIPCWSCAQCWSGNYRLCPNKGGYGQRSPLTNPPGLWGGLADAMYIAPGSVVHKVPDGLNAAAAVGVQILANSVHWLERQGGLRAGDRLLISGCGPQGLVAAIFARVIGAAEVVVTGLAADATRLSFAESVGARTVVVGGEQPPELGSEYDVVLDVSGSPAAMSGGPALLRPQGTMVVAGRTGGGKTVSFMTDMISKRELRIQGVLAKDAGSMAKAITIAAHDARVARELAALTTHEYPLVETVEAIQAASKGLAGFIKSAVRPTL